MERAGLRWRRSVRVSEGELVWGELRFVDWEVWRCSRGFFSMRKRRLVDCLIRNGGPGGLFEAI